MHISRKNNGILGFPHNNNNQKGSSTGLFFYTNGIDINVLKMITNIYYYNDAT